MQVVFHPEDAPDAHAAAQELQRRGRGAGDRARFGLARRGWSTRICRPARSRWPPPRSRSCRWRTPRRSRSRTASRPRGAPPGYRYLDLRRPEMTQTLCGSATRSTGSRATTWTSAGSSRSRRRLLTRSHAGGRARLPRAVAAVAGVVLRAAAVPAAAEAAPDGGGPGSLLPDRPVLPRRGLRAPTGSFEFTQLDLEMSFVDEEDVYRGDRAAVRAATCGRSHGVEVPTPFPRLTYDEVMERFGIGQARPPLRDGAGGPRRTCSRTPASTRSVRARDGGTARIKGSPLPAAASSLAQGARRARPESEGPRRGRARLDRRRGRRRPLAGGEVPRRRTRSSAVLGAHRRRRGRPGPDRRRSRRSGRGGARRAAPARGRPARPDPRGCVAVRLGSRTRRCSSGARRRASGSRNAPPVHGAGDATTSIPKTTGEGRTTSS